MNPLSLIAESMSPQIHTPRFRSLLRSQPAGVRMYEHNLPIVSTHSSLRWLTAFAVSAAVWTTPAWSIAQDTTSIPTQQYEPAPGSSDILGVQSGDIQRHMEWQVGVQLNVADDVLEVRDPDDMTLYKIIDSHTALDLMGAIGLRDRFEIGIVLPFTPYRHHGDDGNLIVIPDLSSTALGDIRIVPKVNIPGLPENLTMAISIPLTLPTGKGDQFYGEGAVGVEPRILAGYRLANGTRLAANIGARLRSGKTFENLYLGNEITFGLGVRAPFKIKGLDMRGVSTIVGSVGLSDPGIEEVPLEWLAGLEYKPNREMTIGLTAGPGITQGYGTPDFRVVFGFQFHRTPPEKPPCPYGPEDMDGFEDDDECAEPDNDGDNISDDDDICPNERETVNGIDDQDGCPEDELAQKPGPILPALTPASDPDNDKIQGDDDLCPDEPEDLDQFKDLDGCPDLDNDNDGIADVDDKCPLQAEIINGRDDEDGCPDKGVSNIVITQSVIQIKKRVYFDTKKATIQERSYSILDQVASTLRANTQITKIRVEGHTDDRGSDPFNMRLSQDRAAAVRNYLMSKGIDAERMVAKGYGETQFIDANTTAAGRANNRRVEFRITEVNGEATEEAESLPEPESSPTPPIN